VNSDTGRELERYTVPSGAVIGFPDAGKVAKGSTLAHWDPYTSPILTEAGGRVKFEDIKEGITMRQEVDESTGLTGRVIIEHRGEYHPQIIIYSDKEEVLAFYTIPAGAHIVVKDNQMVDPGSLLAKTPRKITKTKDITAGLPRVAELFEARRPKDPAIISEIDGMVEFGEARRGQRRIVIKSPTGMKKEYFIPYGKHLNVYKNDRVTSGQALTEGPIVLQEILRISGEKKLQEYLVNEIQEVYRLQGVKINDKHIEVIVRQMLRKVKIEDPGDTDFLKGVLIDKSKFQEENERVLEKKKKPASATPVLLGITKASLNTESFISAASFQETTRVLTEAATSGKEDTLRGLKENVIMGHLIPAGTGFPTHRNIVSSIVSPLVVKEEKNKVEEKDGVLV
ncbi:MAG: DNA-directed RNA polymerase subunit beta', partial [Candidatus Omnitrophica bacterium]|nr:DNA-directed RNA polymerase subunit beta' [Candidatus Omnitrophota bacterium]